MKLDGVLYVQIQDPYEASYGVEHPIYALVLLAQTTMRSELGKITLDKVFEERDSLNANIVKSISEVGVLHILCGMREGCVRGISCGVYDGYTLYI
jgi:hypothetical protein